jgi:hypothetical protein
MKLGVTQQDLNLILARFDLPKIMSNGEGAVTGNGVVERGPGDGSWVCESDLLLSVFKKLNPPEWGRNGGGEFMILGHATCNGAWESLSGKPST